MSIREKRKLYKPKEIGSKLEQEATNYLDDDTENDEPYWSAEQWEEWAYKLYIDFGDKKMTPADMLPEWFINAVEEDESEE